MKIHRWCVVIALASAVLSSACATRTLKREVVNEDGVVATLRHQTQDGVAVDRGFQHPIEISQEKLRAILAAILVRDKAAGVKPAVTGELLRNVARGLAQALVQANPSEEIALTAIRQARRLGIFSVKYLTSFVAYVEDDQLILSFSHIDWDLDREKGVGTNTDRLPQPHFGEPVMKFRVMAGDGFEVVGEQVVKIALHDASPDAAEGDASEPMAAQPEAEIEPQATPNVDAIDLPVESTDPVR